MIKKTILALIIFIVSSFTVLAAGSNFYETTTFADTVCTGNMETDTLNSTKFNFDGVINWINGDLGIGIIPEEDLDVSGDLRINDATASIYIHETAPNNTWEFRLSSNDMFLINNESINVIFITDTGRLQVNDLTAAGSDPLCWDGTGASFVGDCSSLSKYKENINYLQPSYNWLTSKYLLIKPASYTWKSDYMSASYIDELCDENGENCQTKYIENEVYNKTEYGILADDLANVHEALVGYNEKGEVKNVRWFNLITFNVLMIKSIIQKQQQQDARLDEIEETLCNSGATKYC